MIVDSGPGKQVDKLFSRGYARTLTVLLAVWMLAATIAVGQSPAAPQRGAPIAMLFGSAPDATDLELQAIIDDVVGDLSGDWGVIVKKLDTGQFASLNAGEEQVSASLYKLWVLAEFYHQVSEGEMSLDDMGIITYEDAYEDTLIGEQRLFEGDELTFKRAAELMITLSDNTAASFLVRNLGPENINAYMQEIGLSDSYLEWYADTDNMTTPRDISRLLEMMATSELVDAESSAQMVRTLLGQQINNRLPQGLPQGAPIAHKTGDLDNLLHDVGIVYGPSGPFVIVTMASNLDFYDEGWEGIPELARRVYDYFNEQPSSPVRYFPETRQTVGHEFLKVWNEYGDLVTFGYPIGPEQMENGALVQYFERARMELHPELEGRAGAHPTVTLGLLGQESITRLEIGWDRSPNTGSENYVEATGQELSGDFLWYWTNHGGERVFGLPISPEIEMMDAGDGSRYRVQWFQRARMEFYPDLPVGKCIVLATLGTDIYTAR